MWFALSWVSTRATPTIQVYHGDAMNMTGMSGPWAVCHLSLARQSSAAYLLQPVLFNVAFGEGSHGLL